MESSNPNQAAAHQPLRGLRVVEMSHMVMGPACGMILADLGAEVIKIEPLGGDRTRLRGRPWRSACAPVPMC